MQSKVLNKTSQFVVVYTTVEKRLDAENIAKKLVKESLSACVNIIPGLSSIYTWKGKMVKSKEYMLLIKTRKSLLPRLGKVINLLHPYELPEFIAIEIARGSKEYLGWLYENTKRSERRKA